MYLNLLRTLLSVKKRDSYPMYSMTYHGDYAFDQLIAQGITSDDELRTFVKKQLAVGKTAKFNMPDSGCTVFTAKNETGDILFARNYDFSYTPSMLVKTSPKNGYRSFSVIDMSFLGFSKEYLPKGLSGKLPLLAAPYIPADGINEKGLAAAILQVPKTILPNDPNKLTLNTTAIIRLLLDKAATVDEAVAVFQKYNIYFSQDLYCHYLIADKSGKSVIVEFWDGEMHIIEENIASNFYACNGHNLNGNNMPCERYETVKSTLDAGDGKLNMTEAASLLCDVGCYNKDGSNRLQWSVIYNLTSLSGMVFPGRDMSKPHLFHM